MCVLFLAWHVRPDLPLVLVSNRDEAYERPTAPAEFWEDCPHVLAGRDLRAGGTWGGVTTDGRWAILTNIRALKWMSYAAPRSRGDLVREYLCGDAPPEAFAARVAAERAQYGGFNLLVGDRQRLVYGSSDLDEPQPLAPGYYGLSNAALGERWPRVVRGEAAFQRWVEAGAEDADAMLDVMQDRTRAADDELPDTGVGLDLERVLSPLFITSDGYGTRVTWLLTLRADGTARFVEQTYGAGGTIEGRRAFDFEID